MATKTVRKSDSDVYLELVRRVPLRPIRSDQELDQAVGMIDRLIDRARLTKGEQDYLDVLSDLVEAYESKRFPDAPVSDRAALTHLLESREITAAAVARATGLAESHLSGVLSGKRDLTQPQIAKLAKFFRIDPAVFEER